MSEVTAVLACSGGLALGIYIMHVICRTCVETQAARLRHHLEATRRRGGDREEARALLLPISTRQSLQ